MPKDEAYREIAYQTTGYRDAGYMFLLIDFNDGENMQIIVRTWQPEMLNGRPLRKDERINIENLDIQRDK